MSADWRQRLRRASFRGTHFWVETDGVSGGRRIAVHEFPHSELPYNEDLGQQARIYDVSAYVAGEQADSEASALVAACTAKSVATLVLPLFGTIRAHCLEISTDRSKDRHGFVAFRLRFIADGLELSSLGGAPHLRSRIRRKLRDLPPILARAARASLATVGDRNIPGSVALLVRLPDFVLASAVATAESWVSDVEFAVSRSALRGEAASGIAKSISDLYGDMAGLVEVGARVNRYSETSFVGGDSESGAAALVNRTFGVLTDLAVSASPDSAVEAFRMLSDFGEGLDPVPLTTVSRKIEAENQETLVNLFRRSALAHLALSVVNADYASRREAIAARAEINERFGAALNTITRAEQWEVAQEMRDLQGLATEYLSKIMTDLAPVMVVEAPVRMPALYWAYRLYGDASRGDELVVRNEVKHPMWMPVEFEALSR